MTPTVSRLVAGRRQELAYPIRWYSIPNLWRYERPQRGRLREHWQLNVDLFGIQSLSAEHEMIELSHKIMESFGAKPEMYTIKLNSRKFVNYTLKEVMKVTDADAVGLIRLIDHKDKMEASKFEFAVEELVHDKRLTEILISFLDNLDLNQFTKDNEHQSVTELKT